MGRSVEAILHGIFTAKIISGVNKISTDSAQARVQTFAHGLVDFRVLQIYMY